MGHSRYILTAPVATGWLCKLHANGVIMSFDAIMRHLCAPLMAESFHRIGRRSILQATSDKQ